MKAMTLEEAVKEGLITKQEFREAEVLAWREYDRALYVARRKLEEKVGCKRIGWGI